MRLSSVEAAARNNSMWRNAVCRAHGLPTRLDSALWQCTQTTPQYDPNAVTLRGDARDVRTAMVVPGCAIVGYESGEALAWAADAGITPLHPLRVWAQA